MSTATNPQQFSGEWETKRLEELGEISGAGVDKKVNPNEVPVRLVNYLDVYNKTFLYSKDLTHEVSARPDQVRRCVIEKGDIFFTPSSEVPDDIGCSAVAMKDISDGVYSYHVVRLRLKTDWDLYFRAYAFDTKVFLDQASKQCEGSGTRYVITLPKFRAMTVRFPPTVEEQRAIAEVLSDVDGLLNALEALIAKKQAIKQAVMQQLLTGKTRLPGFSGAWETKQLGKMGHCLRGVSYDPTTDLSSFDTDSTVRLLRSNNIQDAVVTAIDVQYVESRKVSESQVMLSDDILVCMANGSKELVGKAGLFRFNDGYIYTFGAFMGCFRVDVSVAGPRFVFYLFQTHEYRNFISLILAGSSINNLKPSDIESAEFKIPDRNEQTAIVSVLSDMDTEIAALEQRRDKTRAIKQGMMQQLLTGRVRLSESRICTDLSDDAD